MYLDIVLAVTIAITFVAMLSRWLILRNRQRRREAEFAQHSITPEQLSEALAKRPRPPPVRSSGTFGCGGQFRDHPGRNQDLAV
jgi:hypothetical protein